RKIKGDASAGAQPRGGALIAGAVALIVIDAPAGLHLHKRRECRRNLITAPKAGQHERGIAIGLGERPPAHELRIPVLIALDLTGQAKTQTAERPLEPERAVQGMAEGLLFHAGNGYRRGRALAP